MKRRIGLAGALAVALSAALTACAGLPMSGPVMQGLQGGPKAGSADIVLLPDGPQKGANPQQIVEGFLRAGSGPSGGWETARLFLAPSFRDTWKPTAGVTVDDFTARSYTPARTEDSDKRSTVDLDVSPVATVDANGTYTATAPTGPTPLSFSLARQPDGEWRITKAPDGIVLDQNRFATVFHAYSLMYWDPTYTYLVPDVRWFPSANAPSRIVQALVKQKPSAWLADSVAPAFPDNVGVSASVPVISGTAQVELSGLDARMEPTALDRMLTLLSTSLATAGYTKVAMSNGSTPINASVILPTTTPAAQPIVLTDKGFGLYQDAGQLDPVPGLDATVTQQHPNAIELSADRQTAVLRVPGGAVGLVGAGHPMAVVDARAGLVGPTLDSRGFAWTVPSDDPSAVHAVNGAGKGGAVAGAWGGASRIEAMRVSHDGTRIAAIVVTGGRPAIAVAGIVRDADGVPQKLSEPVVMGLLPGDGIDLDWIDDSTVGALAHDGGGVTLVEQQVGGIAVSVDAPATAVSIAGASTSASVRLRGDDGRLFMRSGSNWAQAGAGVLVLATVQ